MIPQMIHLKDHDGHELVIASPTACSVAQLLQAQRICLDWNHSGGISQDGHPLSLNTQLDSMSGPHQLSHQMGRVTRPQPPDTIAVGIRHEQTFHLIFLSSGQFLFEGLRQLDILHVNFLVDNHGKIYGADFRVWKPLNLCTLDPTAWPPSFSVRAAGPWISPAGLHDGQVVWTLAAFLQLTPNLLKPMVIYPLTAMQLLGQAGDTQWPSPNPMIGSSASTPVTPIGRFFGDSSMWAIFSGSIVMGFPDKPLSLPHVHHLD